MKAEAIVEALTKRLFIELEASARHVHLTKEAAFALFGHALTPHGSFRSRGNLLRRSV